MDYKNSRMVGDDCIRVPFNCDQGFEEYYLVYVGKSPYERERHLDKVVCSRGPLSLEDHLNCIKTGKDVCWKDKAGIKTVHHTEKVKAVDPSAAESRPVKKAPPKAPAKAAKPKK